MPIRIRIATKIFALAVFLLLLTVALSIFGMFQTRRVRGELDRIAQRDAPLQDIIGRIEMDGLRRSLLYERWMALLKDSKSDAKAIDAVAANYNQLGQEVTDSVSKARAILDRTPPSEGDAVDLARLRGLLEETARNYPLLASIRQRLLDHQKSQDLSSMQELREIEANVQSNLQQRRDEMMQSIATLTERAIQNAEVHEQRLLRVTTAVTGFAILFGLVFAWLTTRRMVQPMEELMHGVQSVVKGDLSVELAVKSSDEIGALTTSFNSMIDELRSKQHMKETFGKYIDPRIVESVILNPSVAEVGGGRRTMTILFCDLVGFTGIGEALTPSGMVRLLNRHFGLMAEAIQKHQGVVDKFIGDAVMAFWGPPFTTSSEHASLACRAALAQLLLLDTLRADLPEITGLRKNIPPIDMRIGLASGEVVVGNIGSQHASSYTVIGDTVNLASRLESVNRVYGTRILLNSDARQTAGASIEAREVDWIAVKGKTEPVAVYELLGLTGEISEERLLSRDRYEEGLAAYRKFDWQAAEAAMREVLRLLPNDGPAKVLLARLEHLQSQPPASDWDGVWRLAEK